MKACKPQRRHDVCIIEHLMESNLLSKRPTAMKRFNRCRLYLQVTFLSELCNGSGTAIATSYFDGSHPSDSASRLRWTRQAQPGPQSWKIWKHVLRQLFLQKPKARKDLKLKQPLGPWIISHTDLRRRYKWWFDLATQTAWTKMDDKWYQHKQQHYFRRFHQHGSEKPDAPQNLVYQLQRIQLALT